ncbi:peptidase S10 [Oscillatoria sp. FACHB-1407]|uniref:S10 family peptidase n=1 Tax=Oscillatoria sp. FACHB-1407 TaxID=2692847 RepID=UPI001684EA98|nr:peptidase S10 [Oscillatoria sp. FACHB-1407]MBD2462455.1 peptidase S10 [Oscillatoria sp. FACHB-1407]
MSDSTPSTTRKSSITEHSLPLSSGEIRYKAIAEWQPLYEREKAIAEIFHVAYFADHQSTTPRPLTFVFNGGPGAASAYLHMGALGPKRVAFGQQGTLPQPPVKVVDNAESWLSFSDLVFIDPVGTGFSRAVTLDKEEAKADEKAKADKPEEKETEFWEVERDLNALAEFIQTFLSKHNRWLSPIFIAGESYGGFRVAKLARKLQQNYGVGLSGAIIISPVLEFSLLEGTDYNVTAWAAVLPSMAGAAVHHNRAQRVGETLQTHLAEAELFARKTLIPFLAMGESVSEDEQQQVYQQIADLIGLPVEFVARQGGRIGIEGFARELLRDRQRIVGLYDASITAIDPFPDRPLYEGTDPTLDGLDRLFTGGINSHLRGTLGVETNLTYHLLNFETFKAWKFELKGGLKQGFIGAVDDLRVGMTLNPYMQVYITHGLFDLVTPYFASNHLADLMKLDPDVRPNLTIQHFQGGHMFYTWEASRQQWFAEMTQFYQRAIA